MKKGALEQKAHTDKQNIAGVDEVGRGCLAGPVYASTVVLNLAKLFDLDNKTILLIRDSKTLSSKQRSKMLEVIHNISLSFAIGIASSLEIEQLGIVGATFLAMKRSLAQISCEVHLLLVDGRATLPEYSGAQQALIKGDSLSFSIAAASILAKEARDSFMREQSKEYQEYGFDEHVGYGTKKHLEAIHKYGICNLHRKNFAPIKYLVDA